MRNLVMLSVLVASISAAPPARAPQNLPPPVLASADSAPVDLTGHATRNHLLGLVDLYTIAFYAGRPFDSAQVLSPEVPKAIRIEVHYKPDLRHAVTIDWRRELVPRLEQRAATLLHGVFGLLKRGDLVLIEYLPDKGTSVRINTTVAVSRGSHELMLAFLDHWIGQRPVSEEIKRRLLQ